MSQAPALLVGLLVAGSLAGSALACSAAKEPEIGGKGSATEGAVNANAAARQERADDQRAAAAAAAAAGETEPTAAPTPSLSQPVAVSDLPARAEQDDTVIVIERGDQEAPVSLAEAGRRARRERAETAGANPSVAAVSDENLHEYQDGHITFAAPTKDESEAGGGGEARASTKQPVRGEAYWRARVLDLRIALREAVDELAELEGRASRLRTSFYAEDDPYVRDGRIKPAWDRALDRIAELHTRLQATRNELTLTLEEGRTAGALPGWLREGLDVEPLLEELPPPRTEDGIHHPGEPVIVDESRTGNPP